MNLDDTDPMLRRTMTSRRVVSLRERLLRAGSSVAYLAPQDVNDPSYFDDHVDAAVRAFQQERGLIVDGLVGPETDRALNEAQYALGDRPLYCDDEHPLRGDDVTMLQHNLSRLGFYYGHLNGVYTRNTHHAVLELQQSLGLPATGVVDRETIAALARINKNITSSKAFSLRDYHRLERATSALRGRSVVLLPSRFAGQTPSAHAPEDFVDRSDEITRDVAVRAYELLHEIGARPTVVCTGGTLVDRRGQEVRTVDRVHEVTATEPDSVVVSLHCDWNRSPAASGVAAYYWGEQDGSEIYSPIGERAAALVLREMAARTGALDLGCHPRQWELLRSMDAPTVWLDLGYLSSPADASALADPEHRNHLAEAVVFGLQRMFLLSDDVPTGTMRLDDVAGFNGL
ncbi:N-acetylmuramoyl-L-alanine amidase [Kocuria dechangensis]|uniref:N-acetylmuramoyl-L-alanine amidase n=1 Tax=Kocuria dechangensis TaxID=1176249 RepID=A0A917LNM5_9MICC|nr:peptidoglycan-binding protein [Kocuria dechangensis]GGG46104.1 N-acetylmuramoyl-L-alanine amidase [Kocuria dechangensis]